MTMDRGLLNAHLQDEMQVNAWTSESVPCDGLSLADLRLRLRYELSNYLPDTLIPNQPEQDIEAQWINDGIGQLWPHDWQAVMKSYIIDTGRKIPQNIFYLPDDCEMVMSVFAADRDVNNVGLRTSKIPHYDGWLYDSAFIDATTMVNDDGVPWLDQPKKAIVIREPHMLGRNSWLVARYARRWPQLLNDYDCINPTPNRIQAIIFYACSQYFNSQHQVSSESIRYVNYVQIAQQFQKLSIQQLIKDSKPPYFS